MLNLIFVNESLIVEQDSSQHIQLPTREYIRALNLPLEVIQENDQSFIAYVEGFNLEGTNIATVSLRSAFNYFDRNMGEQIVYYLQLAHYYAMHKFCGICGKRLIKQQDARFLFCAHCQKETYPKLAPCVIVRITRGNEILLARAPQFPAHVWALIAGFVELGESLEDAIHREIQEEVGIEVENICYWGSESWPIPTSSLMIGFTAEYKRGEIKVDNNEIVEAGFFSKDTIPGKPPTNFSIASRMIEDFLTN